MPVGDITSTERGSGARYNDGKPNLALIPLSVIALAHRGSAKNARQEAALLALSYLGMWQAGGPIECLFSALEALGLDEGWAECADVFKYGLAKYAPWNWAKGMTWSVPLACAARHIVWGILAGEDFDRESKLPHRGHIFCNIVMLITFAVNYLEGDDRPRTVLDAYATQAPGGIELSAIPAMAMALAGAQKGA